MSDPVGSSKREVVVNSTDKIMIYVIHDENENIKIVLQLRKDVPSSVDVEEVSFKCPVTLTLQQTAELIEKLQKSLSLLKISPNSVKQITDSVNELNAVKLLEHTQLQLLGRVDHNEVLNMIASHDNSILNFRVFDNTNGGARNNGCPRVICTIITPASFIEYSGKDVRGNAILQFIKHPNMIIDGRMPYDNKLLLKNNVCVRLMKMLERKS